MLDLKAKESKLTGSIRADEDSEESISLSSVVARRDGLTVNVELQALDPAHPKGVSSLQVSVVIAEDEPDRLATVIFRGATVWTSGKAGVLEKSDILIRDGLIAEIGVGLKVPADCQIIDARKKHITPGLIDCHSHIANSLAEPQPPIFCTDRQTRSADKTKSSSSAGAKRWRVYG